MATTDNQATASEVKAKLTATLTGADSAMQFGLNGAAIVHKARLSQQQRYAAEVEKEFGAQDADVKSAQAQTSATKMAIGQFTAAYQQMTTPDPTVSADEWAFQGRVYDSSAQPLAALTVFLVNGDKTWLRQYGFSYTDDTGLFLLKGAMPTDTGVQMFVEIGNKSGLPIYLDSSSFAPVKGNAIYQKITLKSQTPLGDPPQPIRSVSMPAEGSPPVAQSTAAGGSAEKAPS